MLKIILSLSLVLFSFLFGSIKPESKTEITMCHGLAANDMRQFAMDPAFQALHPAPQPILVELIGETVTFKADDGVNAQGYIIKAKKKSKKWLFVYQEWWGLNDHIKQEADKYYKDMDGKVNVLAIDMYDGKNASIPAEAGKLMGGTKEPRLISIVKAAYSHAGAKAKVANVGWCFGGSWSLRSALIGGKNNVGSVIYYGMPVDDVEKLKTLNGDVLGLFATETRISKEVIEKFAANMKTAGKNLDYTIYDAVHGFSNPSNPKHDAKLAAEAYTKSITFIKNALL